MTTAVLKKAGNGRVHRIKAVLIDLSGTVHVGKTLIPGAVEACQRLVDSQVAVNFLTNTTKESQNQLLTKLQNMGFPSTLASTDNIITTAKTTRHYLEHHPSLKPYCLVEETLLPELFIDDLDSDATANSQESNENRYNCVVVGLAPSAFVYERLNRSFRILMGNNNTNQQLPSIIALHRGRYLRDEDGGLSLGPGGFVACLQEASGIPDSSIVVMGKPSFEFFHSAIPHGILPQETAMIGDDVMQDVIGAKKAGLGLSILVKTGKYFPGDEDVQDEDRLRPDLVAESIVEAINYIVLENNQHGSKIY